MNNNFTIKIDDTVLDWMCKKRKKVLTLSINTTRGGCCPTFELAEICLTRPTQVENFHEYVQDGLRIYLSKKARIGSPTLRFILKKKVFGSSIEAEGLSLKKRDP